MGTTLQVRRRIPIPANWARGLGEALASEITATLPGCRAGYDPVHHALTLDYDRARYGLADIEPILLRRHLWPPTTWFRRLWRAWLLYTEATLRENLHAPASPCCNHPPRTRTSGR